VPIEKLAQWSEKAKTTIEVLVSNMVNPRVLNKIFFKNYRQVDLENTIKLFYRAKRLYEARDEVSTILKAIVEIEIAMCERGAIWRILQDDSQKEMHPQHKQVLENLVTLTSRGLYLIDSFKEQNRIYQDSFCFREIEHTDSLLNQVKVFGGFYLVKKLPIPNMQETGKIDYENADK
jgi:hypothetical protein